MTDRDHQAEQALLGALLVDPECHDSIADLLRPELFADASHREVASEILALLASNQPPDPVLVHGRLAARQSSVPAELPFELARSIGVAGNARHYAERLADLASKRELRRVLAAALNSDAEISGAELVADVARQVSAIETRRSQPARRLGDLMLARLERREQHQLHPELLRDALWPTGFSALDALIGGLRPGHLVTLAARPGVGKTSLISAMADHLAGRGVGVGLFQLEDYADSIADRALMRRSGIPSTLMRDGAPWQPHHWDRAARAVHDQIDLPIVVDDQHQRTIGDVVGAMRRMVREHGVQVVVLDNLAEVVIDAADRREERLDRALGRIAKTFRDAAHAVGIAPVLVVHLNRELEKNAGRPPRISDIKNSGELEDASHVVALLSRERDASTLVVDVAKNRNGPTGAVELEWDGSSMTVRNRSAA